MKNYLSLLSEAQREALERRIALELYIENFSKEDLLNCFRDASQERLTQLTLTLSEESGNELPQMAMQKYGALVKSVVEAEKNTGQSHFIQAAQILVDYGHQHEFV